MKLKLTILTALIGLSLNVKAQPIKLSPSNLHFAENGFYEGALYVAQYRQRFITPPYHTYTPKIDTVACYMQVAHMGDTVGVIRTQWQSGYSVSGPYTTKVLYLDDKKRPIKNLVFFSITK